MTRYDDEDEENYQVTCSLGQQKVNDMIFECSHRLLFTKDPDENSQYALYPYSCLCNHI